MNRDLSHFKNLFRQFNDAVIRAQETGFASKYRSPFLSHLLGSASLRFAQLRSGFRAEHSLNPNSRTRLSIHFFLILFHVVYPWFMILDNYHRAARMTYDFHISLFNKLVRPAEADASGLIDSLTHRGDRGLVKLVLFFFFFFV